MIALSEVEANGIRIDTKYLKKTRKKLQNERRQLLEEMREDDIYKVWRRRYGAKTNLGAGEQLANILFVEMGMGKTKLNLRTMKLKRDSDTLSKIDHPFVRKWQRAEKLRKCDSTFLGGIQNETCGDGLLHPVFNLHIPITYRSSSDSPNFQNFPVRDPEIGKLVRESFISRKNHQLVEVDYGAVEVRVAACYNEDPALIEYIKDPTKDMHRDMAAQCFMLKPKQVSKHARYSGKNMFVFPQFYGDFYAQNAFAMWNYIEEAKICVEGTEKSLYKHLKKQGIKKLGKCDPESQPVKGTFEHHIQQVERDFWGRRFKVYAKWKDRWWREYQKKGWAESFTGFRFSGVYRRNEIINYPIQGAAFHCLLWSLIELQKELRRRKMKTVIVGQIHDSIIADVHKDELEDYLALAKEISTKQIRKVWKWIIVPLEVEAEVSPLGGSWHDKKEYDLESLGA